MYMFYIIFDISCNYISADPFYGGVGQRSLDFVHVSLIVATATFLMLRMGCDPWRCVFGSFFCSGYGGLLQWNRPDCARILAFL